MIQVWYQNGPLIVLCIVHLALLQIKASCRVGSIIAVLLSKGCRVILKTGAEERSRVLVSPAVSLNMYVSSNLQLTQKRDLQKLILEQKMK